MPHRVNLSAPLDDLVGIDLPSVLTIEGTASAETFRADATARFFDVRRRQALRHHAEAARHDPSAALVPTGLAPFRTLPPQEPATLVRTRMAAEIARAVSAQGNVTRPDLRAAGFTEAEIDHHFDAALRASRVSAMAA